MFSLHGGFYSYLFIYLLKLILNDCSYLAGQYCGCTFNYFSGSMLPDNLSSICAVAELQKNPFNRHLNTQSFSLGRNKINDNCYLHRHTWMQKIYLSYLKAAHSSRLLLWIFCHKPSWAHFQILLHTLNRSILPAAMLSAETCLGCAGVWSAALKFQKLYGFSTSTSPWCHLARSPAAGTAALRSTARVEQDKFQQDIVTSRGAARERPKRRCSIAWHHIGACVWF